MDNNNKKNEIKIELTPEVAAGIYSNIAMIAHSANEFFIDFITSAPNVPKAMVKSRIIMNPENAKNLLFALRDNIMKYEQTFGTIERKLPLNNNGNNNGNGEIPNPFMTGGKA